MSSACSAENACAGFVSIAPAMNMPTFSRASSSSVCVSEPARERDLVEVLRLRVRRLLGIDLGDERVELLDEREDLLLGRRRHREDVALELLHRAIGAGRR